MGLGVMGVVLGSLLTVLFLTAGAEAGLTWLVRVGRASDTDSDA